MSGVAIPLAVAHQLGGAAGGGNGLGRPCAGPGGSGRGMTDRAPIALAQVPLLKRKDYYAYARRSPWGSMFSPWFPFVLRKAQ
jgi:hypothetical protein